MGKENRKIEGTGKGEAGNETVLGQSWREKILTTQHFLPPFNPEAHTVQRHTQSKQSLSCLCADRKEIGATIHFKFWLRPRSPSFFT